MRNAAGLRQEDHLIDAGLLELLQARANLRGRADAVCGAAFGQREVLGLVLVVLPDVGLAGLVIAEKCVMTEAVEKKSLMLRRQFARLLLVAIAQERTRDRDIRIDRVTGRLAFVFQRRVVIVHPLARLL